MSRGHVTTVGAAASEQFDGLDRLIVGDKAAWDRFVTRFAPVIFAAIRRKLVPAGRGEDAEDVAQDVFIRLCARDFHVIRRYDASRAKLSTWLTVIAHSAAIDHLRRQKARAQPIETVPERYLAVDPPKEPITIDIPPDLLSPRQALVLEMLYRREMEVAEAAQVLGVNPQTVRSTHHKALIKLRAHFREPED
jgi:RNA polymerase sigma-70 factor (ECF subfamily)